MTIPSLGNLWRRFTGRPGTRLDERFRKIYLDNLFGGSESRSGIGSSREQTAILRRELPGLCGRLQAGSVLDAPCGDCHWIQELDWSKVAYTGVDIVPELIKANQQALATKGMNFITADLCTAALPRVDLILCRDCWVHLEFAHIRQCLANFRRTGSRYLLTTTFPKLTKNRDLGRLIWRPLNLQSAPFNFPPPLELLNEGCTEGEGQFSDKSLGLWLLQELVCA